MMSRAPFLGLALFTLCLSPAARAEIHAFRLVGQAGEGLLGGNEPGFVNGGSGGETVPGISYDDQSKTLSIQVDWGSANGFQDLTGPATAAHIHGPTASAYPDNLVESAGVRIGLDGFPFTFNPSASGGFITGTSLPLDATQEAELFAGRWYINVHTSANPGGEIRGFLAPELLVTSANDLQPGSLRDAVAAAQLLPGPNTVLFTESLRNQNVLTFADLTIPNAADFFGVTLATAVPFGSVNVGAAQGTLTLRPGFAWTGGGTLVLGLDAFPEARVTFVNHNNLLFAPVIRVRSGPFPRILRIQNCTGTHTFQASPEFNSSLTVQTDQSGTVRFAAPLPLGNHSLAVDTQAAEDVVWLEGTLSRTLPDGFALRKTGPGRLRVSGSFSTAPTLSAHAQGGTLELASINGAVLGAMPVALHVDLGAAAVLEQAEQIADNASVTVQGELRLNANETLDRLEGNGAVNILAGIPTLTVGSAGGSSRFDGPLNGPVNLAKTGTGIFTHSGNSASAGTIRVQGGMLNLLGNHQQAGLATVLNGTLAGTGEVRDLRLEPTGILSPGDQGGGVGTFSARELTWDSGGRMAFQLDASGVAHDRLVLSGNLVKSPGNSFIFDFQGTGGRAQSYELVTFSGTTFTESDFTAQNLAPGLGGGFSIVEGNRLVFTTDDPLIVRNNSNSGPGSLRAALAFAAGLAGPDTISFDPAGMNGREISLSGAEIVLDDPEGVTLDALRLPAGLTLRAPAGNRVFRIPAGRTATLMGLTLTGGGGGGGTRNGDGGAVLNQGTLNLTRCVFTGNSATGNGGALANISESVAPATLNARYCSFSNNNADLGGAIASQTFALSSARANLNLTGCAFFDNKATSGGAVHSGTPLVGRADFTAEACTFSRNQASANGGAISLVYDLSSPGAITQFSSCTLTGNTADLGGGIYFVNFLGNGTCHVANCIIAGNSAVSAYPDLTPVVTSAGHNFIGNGDGLTTATGDLVGSAAAPLDPRLGPLAHHGGPTLSMMPLPGSPVRDAGATASTLDQRLLPRSAGAAPDIGAVEANPNRDAGPLVGFNFNAGGAGVLGPAERAGYPPIAQANWNNLTTEWAGANNGAYTRGPTPLLNADGAAFTPNLRLWWQAPNTYTIGGSPVSPDQRLMFGYLDSNGAANAGGNDLTQAALQPTFSVADLSAADALGGYDVLVYTDGDAADGRVGEYWITSNRGGNPADVYGEVELTPHRFPRDDANFAGAYTLLPASANSAGSAASANVLVLPDVTETAFTLRTEEVNFRAPINAVQLVKNPRRMVTTAVDELDPGGPGEGAGLSLREALRDLVDGGAVVFAPALSGAEIQLTLGELPLPVSAVVDASNLPGGLTLSALNSRHFTVPAGRSLHLIGLTLRGGTGTGLNILVDGFGGAIASDGELRLTRCTLVNNFARFGGAVDTYQANTILDHCNIALNFATTQLDGSGGGLRFAGGTALFFHTTVSFNEASTVGGGLEILNGATVRLSNSVVSGNHVSPATPQDIYATDSGTVLGYSEANAVGVVELQSNATTSGPAPIVAEAGMGFGNYGGGRDTFHPLPGSPARNNGVRTAGTPRLDSRGLPRVIGGVPDLGAVEEVATHTAPYANNGRWNVYLVGPEFLTWSEAEAYARSLSWEGKPGHLVAIQSAEENEFVRQIAGRTFCWIGLTDNESFGGTEAGSTRGANWKWVGGENGNYRNWRSGQPDNQGGQDGVVMHPDGTWADEGMGAQGEDSPRFRSAVIEFEVRNPNDPAVNPAQAIKGTIAAQPLLPPFPIRQQCNGAEGLFLGVQFAGLPVVPRHLTEAGRALADPNGLGGTRTDGITPVINLTDFQDPGIEGLFPNDQSFPLNNATPDDRFAVYFRAHLRVTPDLAGTWTFQLRGDDGCALRIPGLAWREAAGSGKVDPADPSALVFPETTGDTYTFGVIDLPVGEYDIEYVTFEADGGASAEVSAGRGVYPADTAYRLLGDAAGLPVSASPASLAFNGVDDYLELGGGGVALGNVFTMEAWILSGVDTFNLKGILGNQPVGGTRLRSPSLWIDRARVHGGFGTGVEWSSWITDGVMVPFAWNHVAYAHDGATTRVYVNGELALTFTPSGPSINTPVKWIGKVDTFFTGRLDEVRLWTVARTQAEIRGRMQTTLVGNEPGLAAYWRMDACAGTAPVSIGPARPTTAFGSLLGGQSWTPLAAPAGLASLRVIPTGVSQFTFRGQVDGQYRVWAAPDVQLPARLWTDLGPAASGAPGQFLFNDPAAATEPARFYRIDSQ